MDPQDPQVRFIAEKNKQTFETINSMIADAVERMDAGESHVQVDFDKDLVFTIRIKGEDWDERIDERIAKFVIELQDSLDLIHKEAANYEVRKENRVRVKVKIEKGSSLVNVELGEFLSKALGNMTPTQTMIVLLAGVGIAGAAFTTKAVLNYLENVKNKAQDEETKRSLGSALERVATLERDLSAPNRKLVSRMCSDDTIQLPGESEPLTKEQAKALFPRAPRSKKLQGQIYGEFEVVSIDRSELIPALHLADDEREFKAKLPIQGDRLKAFFEQLERDTEKRMHGTFKLQLTVKYTAKGITDAVVDDVGEPDEPTQSLSELLKMN